MGLLEWPRRCSTQVPGAHWVVRKAALLPALFDAQVGTCCAGGSWDAVGPRGYSGGRIYSTACGALCVETLARYAQPTAKTGD